MADRPENNAKSKETSPHLTSNTDLQTAIDLPELDTPTSTSSSRFSLRNLTPRLTATNKKVASDTGPSTPAMDPSQYTRSEFEPWAPSPNIHNKLQPGTPPKSKTARVTGIARAIDVGKRLQRIMGVSEPVPFVTPPAMLKDLEQEFVAGMQEYGLNNRMQNMGLDALSQAASMQERLPVIMEENRSPIKAAWTPPQSGQEEGTSDSPPVWLSDVRSTPNKDPKKPIGDGTDNQQPPALAPSSGMSVAEFETLMNEPMLSLHSVDQQAIASSPPRMTSQGSEADTTLLDGSQPVYASYDTPSFAAFRKQMDAFEEQHVPAHSYASPNMGSEDIPTSYPKQAYSYDTASGSTSGYGSAFGSVPKPLFPAPRVGTQSWGEDVGASQQPRAPVQLTPAAISSPGNAFLENLFRQPPTTNVPRIVIQAPSPTRLPSSKKRLAPLAADELFGPALKGTRPDEKKATGLPTLPASSSASWEPDFPGYTPTLLTILLTWSHAMQSFYRRLPDPKTFPLHAAFPHRITPPAYSYLLSVGLYDTSVVPHKKIRFLGPGDAAEIGYAEVDVFRSKEDVAAFEAQEQESSKFQAMKQKLGLGFGYAEPKAKVSVYQAQTHLAMGGEGRWAYILIKGHVTSQEEVAPHVMLAWHISAVTDTSSCLHTVFPDTDEPALSHPLTTPTPPKQSLGRFASLQNLMSPSRGQKHLHREIRSASSSSELPQVDVSSILPEEGAQTLKRTVVKLGKAGSVPLIEGYRVGVKEFKGWLDAVGRGEGKVILWRE